MSQENVEIVRQRHAHLAATGDYLAEAHAPDFGSPRFPPRLAWSKTSGLPVDMAYGQVFTIRDGKFARMEMYAGHAEALEAVGLSGVP